MKAKHGEAMIEIKNNNIYKVLKPELFIPETKLLDKYQLWLNITTIPNLICFREVFHSYDSDGYDHGNSVWFGFNPEENTIRLKCSSMGGMCGFNFSEEDLKGKLTDLDRQCIEFTINMIKKLIEEGVIEEIAE